MLLTLFFPTSALRLIFIKNLLFSPSTVGTSFLLFFFFIILLYFGNMSYLLEYSGVKLISIFYINYELYLILKKCINHFLINLHWVNYRFLVFHLSIFLKYYFFLFKCLILFYSFVKNFHFFYLNLCNCYFYLISILFSFYFYFRLFIINLK